MKTETKLSQLYWYNYEHYQALHGGYKAQYDELVSLEAKIEFINEACYPTHEGYWEAYTYQYNQLKEKLGL